MLGLRHQPGSFFPETPNQPVLIDGLAVNWVNPYVAADGSSPLRWHESDESNWDLVAVAEQLAAMRQLPNDTLIDVPTFVRRELLQPAEPAEATAPPDDAAFARRELLRRLLYPETSPSQPSQPESVNTTPPAPDLPPDQLRLESPHEAEFAEELTRVEIITRLAERLADDRGRLPSMWAVEKALGNTTSRSLLDDPGFSGHLKGYQAGQEAFVAHVGQQLQNPRYQSEVLPSAARAAYLDKHQAGQLLAEPQREVSHDAPGRVW